MDLQVVLAPRKYLHRTNERERGHGPAPPARL